MILIKKEHEYLYKSFLKTGPGLMEFLEDDYRVSYPLDPSEMFGDGSMDMIREWLMSVWGIEGIRKTRKIIIC